MKKSKSLHDQITSAITTNILKYVFLIPIQFIMVPIYLKYLGVDLYGIWILINTFFFTFAFCEFNITISLMKYIPEYRVREEYLAINKVVNTVSICLLVSAVIVLFLLFLFLDKIIQIFFRDTFYISETIKTVFFIMMLVFVCNLLIFLLYSIFSGLQRYDLRNYLNIFVSVFTAIGMFIVLVNGGGLIQMAMVNFIISFFSIIFFIFILKHIFPQLNWSLHFFDFSILKNIYSYSLKIFITTLSGIANFHLPKLILGYFLGSSYVSYFHIGHALVYYTREIPGLLSQPILSATSELNTRNERKNIENLYLWTNKYINILGLLICVGLFIFSKEFVTLWLGRDYNEVILLVKILSVAYFINNFTYSPVNILFGVGKPEYPMYTAILNSLLTAVFGIVLTNKYGYNGMLFAIFISILISVILFKIIFYWITKFSFSKMLKNTLLKPIFAISFCSGAYLLFHNLINLSSNFLFFFVRIIIFSGMYLVVLMVSGENLKFYQYVENNRN